MGRYGHTIWPTEYGATLPMLLYLQMGMWIVCTLFDRYLYIVWPRMSDIIGPHRRVVARYIIEIVTTSVIIGLLARPMHALFNYNQIVPDLLTYVQFSFMFMIAIYSFELIMRPELKWHMVLHHVTAISGMSWTANMIDERVVLRDMPYVVSIFVLLILGMFTEQLVFTGLVLYRMRMYRAAYLVMYASSFQNAVCKLGFNAYGFWVFLQTTMPAEYWCLWVGINLCVLIPTQGYACYVQYVIARNISKKMQDTIQITLNFTSRATTLVRSSTLGAMSVEGIPRTADDELAEPPMTPRIEI